MTSFFSCDWGTTWFRLRRVNAETGHVIDERREASGVRVLFSSCAPGDTTAREKVFANFRVELATLSWPAMSDRIIGGQNHGAQLDHRGMEAPGGINSAADKGVLQ